MKAEKLEISGIDFPIYPINVTLSTGEEICIDMCYGWIFLVYVTLSTGEEVRIHMCHSWKEARKVMQAYKRKGLASRALYINTESEKAINRSILAPVYFTL